MRYRPDIEGMRAMAILLVVAAHVGVPGMEAGFIGVDVFFVISGYLITGLLIAEKSQTGRIGIAAFYARRFRRLLPSLLIVLLATAIVAGFLLPPQEQADQAAAGAAASAWASNLYFAFGRIDYFDSGSDLNVYLHTWSLGVEEQFYIVWPWLIFLLVPPGNFARKSSLVWGMTAILAVSLLACIWASQTSAHYAFYLMPFRAWQFAAGALTCKLGMGLLCARSGGRAAWIPEVLGFGGIVIILLGLALVRTADIYPGGWAVLPTLGTVSLLLAARAGNPLITRALASTPMQAIGRVSYGWYLWHWPVLVLGALLAPASGIAQRLGFALVALALATVSYRLVEAPLRRNAAVVREPGRFILASLLAMLAAVLLFVQWSETARAGSQSLAASSQGKSMAGQVPVIYSMGCDDWYRSDLLRPCVFGPESAPKTAVVIGDSIGLQWFPAYVRVFAGPQWRLVVLTKSSCPMVDSPIINSRIMREFTECANWRDKALTYIAQTDPDIVILGSSHTAGFNQQTWISGTGRVLARIAPFARRVYIMRSTPVLPFSGPTCLWAHQKNERTLAADVCSAPATDRLNDDVALWLGQAAQGWENVHMLDMNEAVCPDGTCRAMRDGILIYRDTQHLTAEYAESLADTMRVRLDDAPGTSGD